MIEVMADFEADLFHRASLKTGDFSAEPNIERTLKSERIKKPSGVKFGARIRGIKKRFETNIEREKEREKKRKKKDFFLFSANENRTSKLERTVIENYFSTYIESQSIFSEKHAEELFS